MCQVCDDDGVSLEWGLGTMYNERDEGDGACEIRSRDKRLEKLRLIVLADKDGVEAS